MNEKLGLTGLAKQQLEPLRSKMGALNVVGGIGPVPARLMIIGEAPGQDEDEQDMPFVGRCGDLLNKMLKDAGLNRDDIYITNTVKCRPTVGKRNRPPTQEEIDTCKSILWKEIQAVSPLIIVTLGLVATQNLLKGTWPKQVKSMKSCFGEFFTVKYMSGVVIPLWHPSYLMRGNAEHINTEVEVLKKIKESL